MYRVSASMYGIMNRLSLVVVCVWSGIIKITMEIWSASLCQEQLPLPVSESG